MNSLSFNKFQTPIVTGTPGLGTRSVPVQHRENSSFQEILAQKLDSDSEVAFSKHAAQRVAQREVNLTEDSVKRLNQGVQLAKEKGLNETLILVDQTAFIVNVKNNLVVTTVNSGANSGNIFTNIEGTVII